MTDKQDVPGDLFLGYMADLLELRKERTAAKNLREWIDAHPARYTPDPELAKVTAERDEARETARKLNREKQQLESLNADARRMVAEVPGTGGSYAQHFLRAYRAYAAEKERAQVAESLLASRTTAIEAAIEAMEPFAGFIAGNDRVPDDMPLTAGSMMARKQVTASAFRNAAIVLAQLRSLIAGKDEITTVDLLSELLACVWRPNPYDHSRIDIAPGKHHKFQALVERAVTAKGAKLPSRALPKNTLIAGKETDVV